MIDEARARKVGTHARRLRVPAVGMSLGFGLFIAECIVVLSGFLDSFGGAGAWRQLLLWLLIYVMVGGALDLLVQILAPGRFRFSVVARGLPMAAAGTVALVVFGGSSPLLLWVMPLGVVAAVCLHVRWGIPLVVGAALWGFLPAVPTAAPPPGELSTVSASGPSFVVIVLDTARRDRSSTYGYARETTPNLSALAARGVRFDRAYSTSCWSVPAHASLFTGLYPTNHHAHFEHTYLDTGFATIADRLAAAGYETVGYSPNPYVASGTGMTQGFTSFSEIWRSLVFRRFLAAGQLWDSLRAARRDKGGAAILEQIRAWSVSRDSTRPYFLFVNVLEAHAPYQDVPRRFLEEFVDATPSRVRAVGKSSFDAQWIGSRVETDDLPVLSQLLDAATAAADHYLGEILAAVPGDPVVVVLSDHGDLMGEHDLYGHMTSLYEPLIRIPLVMAGPGVSTGTVDDPVTIADVMPTLLAVAGVEAGEVDGIDLTPLMAGEASMPDRILPAWHFDTAISTVAWTFNRTPREMSSIRARRAATISGNLKRIVASDGTDLGFDLGADPGERRPFPGDRTDLIALVPDPGDVRPIDIEDMDPAQIEALKALGYIH